MTENASGDSELVTISSKELSELRNSLESWKKYSRKHEDDLNELRHTVLVDRISDEAGLPKNLKKFLTGKDEVSLKEQATELAASIVVTPPPAPVVETTSTPEVKEEVKDVVTPESNPEPAPVVEKTIVTNPLAGVGGETKISDPMAVIGAEIAGLFSR